MRLKERIAMKTITYQQQINILEKAYLNCNDLQMLIPIGTKQAYKLIQEIYDEMEQLKIPFFNQRQKLVPTSLVVKKLKLDVNYIKKQGKEN